jgi:hypothetical protein
VTPMRNASRGRGPAFEEAPFESEKIFVWSEFVVISGGFPENMTAAEPAKLQLAMKPVRKQEDPQSGSSLGTKSMPVCEFGSPAGSWSNRLPAGAARLSAESSRAVSKPRYLEQDDFSAACSREIRPDDAQNGPAPRRE